MEEMENNMKNSGLTVRPLNQTTSFVIFFFSCVCAVDSSWQISPRIYTNLSCLVTLLFVFLSPTFLALYNVFPEPYVLKTDGSYSLYFAESFMFFLKRFYVNF